MQSFFAALLPLLFAVYLCIAFLIHGIAAGFIVGSLASSLVFITPALATSTLCALASIRNGRLLHSTRSYSYDAYR